MTRNTDLCSFLGARLRRMNQQGKSYRATYSAFSEMSMLLTPTHCRGETISLHPIHFCDWEFELCCKGLAAPTSEIDGPKILSRDCLSLDGLALRARCFSSGHLKPELGALPVQKWESSSPLTNVSRVQNLESWVQLPMTLRRKGPQ